MDHELYQMDNDAIRPYTYKQLWAVTLTLDYIVIHSKFRSDEV